MLALFTSPISEWVSVAQVVTAVEKHSSRLLRKRHVLPAPSAWQRKDEARDRRAGMASPPHGRPGPLPLLPPIRVLRVLTGIDLGLGLRDFFARF